MPIKASIEFAATSTPITAHVTKFGGQPVWLEQAQWPVSKTTGNPMRFIGQIALDRTIFPNVIGKIAYIFMTDEEEHIDGTWEADGGENALIIQPGLTSLPIIDLSKGPTLYEMVAEPGNKLLTASEREYSVDLIFSEDPIFEPEEKRYQWTDEQFDRYAQTLAGNKIGGSPIFLQSDEFPSNEAWSLLLQLDSTRVPFYINFGDAGIAYAFINSEGTVGKLLWQCS